MVPIHNFWRVDLWHARAVVCPVNPTGVLLRSLFECHTPPVHQDPPVHPMVTLKEDALLSHTILFHRYDVL